MDFALLQSCFYQWVLHFLLLSNLSAERKVKESQTNVSIFLIQGHTCPVPVTFVFLNSRFFPDLNLDLYAGCLVQCQD